MQKFLAKVDNLEAWLDDGAVVIKGLKDGNTISIESSEFFLLEKVVRKVVRGFLNGD